MRLIDADALDARMYYEAFEKDSADQRWDSGCWIRYKLFEKVLKEAPTIEERKTGKWIPQPGGGYCCSKCGRYALHDVDEKFALLFTKSKYCPNCGAKMKGESDE